MVEKEREQKDRTNERYTKQSNNRGVPDNLYTRYMQSNKVIYLFTKRHSKLFYFWFHFHETFTNMFVRMS